MHARLALALALACSACTHGATAASRTAWNHALARPTDQTTGSASGSGGRGPARTTRDGDVWQQLSRFTTDALDLLADGSTTISLPQLAERLCSEVPEALAADPAADAVQCTPKKPLAPLGHDLELELGRASTIGLYARELSDQDSDHLVRQSLQKLAPACREPWTPVPRGADNAHEEIHTCPTASGALLVLGRVPTDLGGGRWRFSLAVLGPG